MRITADTNVLVRAAVLDDPQQAELAKALLESAELIAVPLACLCEFVWVLRRAYRWQPQALHGFITTLIAAPTVETDRLAVEAGLAMLEAGGDFADGVIAYEGRRLGGVLFASFDRAATELVAAQGGDVLLLEASES